MAASLNDKIVIAISSRALFDLDDSNTVFEEKGLDEYIKYQIEHENETLKKGVAFSLIKKLLDIRYPHNNEGIFEVILVSRNDANTGLRVFNAIEHYGLDITRAAFTGGNTPYKYLKSFNSSLFLSAKNEDVSLALANGYAAATILKGTEFSEEGNDILRIAFDGDAVIFSDESEAVYKNLGIEAFKKNESDNSEIPLNPGPFKPFLESLSRIQKAFAGIPEKPIRTALVTARNAPAHKRAIKTLRHWGVNVDEAFFLGGLDKTPILEQFKPHIFFDDQMVYCDPASKVVPTGHVPAGIANL